MESSSVVHGPLHGHLKSKVCPPRTFLLLVRNTKDVTEGCPDGWTCSHGKGDGRLQQGLTNQICTPVTAGDMARLLNDKTIQPLQKTTTMIIWGLLTTLLQVQKRTSSHVVGKVGPLVEVDESDHRSKNQFYNRAMLMCSERRRNKLLDGFSSQKVKRFEVYFFLVIFGHR